MADQSPTTDILTRIQRELAHPIMRHSGSGEVGAETLLDAAAEIERLRGVIAEMKDQPDQSPTTAESRCAGALARSGRRPPEVCPRCGATDNDFCGHPATQERQIAEMANAR